MKWLKRILLTLLLAAVLLLTVLGLLLGTRPGVEQLFQLANRFIPGELGVEQVQGNLLGDLRLAGVRFAGADMEVQAGQVVLRWNPRALLQRRFHLLELRVADLDYRQLKASEPAQEPFRLPDLELPLEIVLEQVAVERVKLVTAPDAAPVTIRQVQLAADWTARGVNLSRLALDMPEAKLDSSGRLQPVGDYPMDLKLDWKLTMEGLPAVQGQGGIRGDLRELRLTQKLEGDLAATVEAKVRDLLQTLAWDARLLITRLPEKYLQVEVPKDLKIDLDGKGDLQKASARIRLQGTPRQGGEAERMALDLLADLGFEKQAFRVEGNWKNLQWPLAGAPQVLSQHGELTAAGVPDDYTFELRAGVRGSEVPEGQWRVLGKGDLEQVAFEAISGQTLDGQVEARGQVAWKDGLGWDLQLAARQIDPGAFRPDWPGRLDLKLVSRAQTRNGQLVMDAVLEQLQGTLNDQPIAGKGRFRMEGGEYVLDGVELASGSARLDADGRVGRQWDLEWKLAVPRLGDLLPSGQGAIQGQGRLLGTADKPVVAGTLGVRELNWGGYRVASSDARFDLGLDDSYRSSVAVRGSDLFLAGQKIASLALDLQGPMKDQRISLQVKHELADLRLGARGALDREKLAWKGRLEQLSATGEEVGDWQLRQPSALDLSAQKVSLTPLCLVDGQAELCLKADRFPDKGNADLEIKGLSLERFQPLLPPEIQELTGTLSATAHADLGTPVKASLEAKVSPGALVYLDPQSRPVRLEHRDGTLLATYDPRRLSARWNIRLGEHSASGDLAVPRAALDADPMRAPLSGKVDLAITELGLVQAFVPDIQEIDGKVDVALKLGGTLGDPAVTGHALVDASRILIPRAGLDLEEMRVNIQGTDGRTLTLSGQVLSGQGRLDLGGGVTLDARQGWPARVTLKGENFQLANLPEAQVVVSPDMKLESGKEFIRVRGRLEVPKALVEINDLPPGTVDASSDVVVLGQEGEEQVMPSTLDGEVEVVLGDNVHFAGFGLNVDLGGKLTVTVRGGRMPTASGELIIKEGSFRAYGQDLTIEKGRISWAGGIITNPVLRLQATRRVDDIVVGLRVNGSAKKPRLTAYSSDPDVTEKEAMAMLITGQRSGDITQASIYAGRQITPDLSVGVNLGGGDRGTEFVARYRLMKNVRLEGTSSARKSGASINYTFEID